MQIDLFNCSHHTWSIFALKNCTTFSQTGFCQILSLGLIWSKFCNWQRDSGGRDQHGSPAKWTLNCRHKLRYETGRKDPLWIFKCFFGYVFLESDFAFSVIRSYWQARGWWLLMKQQSASVADKSTFFWLPMPTCLRVSLLPRNQTHPSECKCPNINWKHSHGVAHIKLPCLLISLVNVLRLPRFLLWIKSQEFSVWLLTRPWLTLADSIFRFI